MLSPPQWPRWLKLWWKGSLHAAVMQYCGTVLIWLWEWLWSEDKIQWVVRWDCLMREWQHCRVSLHIPDQPEINTEKQRSSRTLLNKNCLSLLVWFNNCLYKRQVDSLQIVYISTQTELTQFTLFFWKKYLFTSATCKHWIRKHKWWCRRAASNFQC